MEALIQDLRQARRRLVRTPAFTSVVVLTLALGIGANTAIFSVINAALLRPLPYAEAERLVMIWDNFEKLGMYRLGAKPAEYLDYRDQTRSFAQVSAFRPVAFNLIGGGDPVRLSGARVTPDLFATLGARAAAGRLLAGDDVKAGAENVVVLSHGLWQRRFNRDPGIIGRKIDLDGVSYIVVGVTESGFAFPHPSLPVGEPAELWAPLALDPAQVAARRGPYELRVIARLAAGSTLRSARAEMDALAARLDAQNLVERGPRGEDGGWRVSVVPLQEEAVGDGRRLLFLMAGVALLVLLVACANIANLLLVRGASRSREIALRAALGAGRGRIIRELLLESLLIALAGGSLGLLLARWGVDLLSSFGAGRLPRATEIDIDWQVMVFTAAVSVATSFIFGLAPALASSSVDLQSALRDGGAQVAGSRRGRARRGLLVVAEVALALVVLIGAGLMIRSLLRLSQTDPGIDPNGALAFEITLPPTRYGDEARTVDFYERLVARISALPGVTGIGAGSALPLAGGVPDDPFSIEGRPLDPNHLTVAGRQAVSPGYFRALGIPLRRGREFNQGDVKDAPSVTIINERLARQYFPGEDPLGRQIKLGAPRAPGPWRTIVGVVGDVPRWIESGPQPDWYAPQSQMPARRMFVIARAGEATAGLIPAIRREVLALDPELPITNVRALDEVVASSGAPRRFNTALLASFAALAAALAALGVYSALSSEVAQRRREIGVRLALGAQPRDVRHLIVRQGMILASAGLTAGLALALALARTMTSLLYGIGPHDPLTFALITAGLALIALGACCLPARRAARVDPIIALRNE